MCDDTTQHVVAALEVVEMAAVENDFSVVRQASDTKQQDVYCVKVYSSTTTKKEGRPLLL